MDEVVNPPETKTWVKVAAAVVIGVSAWVCIAIFMDYQRAGDRAAQAAEAAARLPAMPVSIAYRKAVMGPGLVVIFKNQTQRSLSLSATFTNPTLHQQQTFRVDLAPMGSREVGHLEGWNFASGDTVKLAHADYKPMLITLP
jgi:hypothetical protein